MSETSDILEKVFEAKFDTLMQINEAQSRDIADIKQCLSTFMVDCRARHEGLDKELAEIRQQQAFRDGHNTGVHDLSNSAMAKLVAAFTAVAAMAAILQWWVMRG